MVRDTLSQIIRINLTQRRDMDWKQNDISRHTIKRSIKHECAHNAQSEVFTVYLVVHNLNLD